MGDHSNRNRHFKSPDLETDFRACRTPALLSTQEEAGLAKNRDLRKGPHYPWHDEIGPLFHRRYQVLDRSPDLTEHDWSLLRRTCGALHPSQITVTEMEQIILSVRAQATRSTYVTRFKSIWRVLRSLGLIPTDCTPDELLPNIRKPRGVPRPISTQDAELLMSEAAKPREREWFAFALLGGFRAMEVAAVEGAWLEQDPDGFSIRIKGKGRTNLTIPCHERLLPIFDKYRTLGPLYGVTNGTVSDLANAEMKRLGVRGTFHGCRHFFITSIYQQTGDLLLASELARHQNLNTTRGYAQLKQGRKREVLNQLFASDAAPVVA